MSKKKQEEWVCTECGPITIICEHLETLLPSMNAGNPPTSISSEAASSSTVSFFTTIFPPTNPKGFLELIRNYGVIEKWEVELLEAYFCRNLSAKEIVEEFGWVGDGRTLKSAAREVQRRIKMLKEELKRRGIRQELE